MKYRKIAFTFSLFFTLIIFFYFLYCIEFLVKDSYMVFEGCDVNKMLPPGISLSDDTMEAGKSGRVKEENTVRVSNLKILHVIPAGKVSITTVDAPTVFPSGKCIGIKMYSRGLLVSGFSDFEGPGGICVSPGAAAGLKAGDVIRSINGVATSSVSEFAGICDESGGECTLAVTRDGKELKFKVIAKKCVDGHMRMGIFVKNSIAGIGTMTYVSSDMQFFGALGHGITDFGTLVPMNSALVYDADILDVRKGYKGAPGEVIGAISEENLIGECTKNSGEGIYGVLSDFASEGEGIKAAPSTEVKEGKAHILCSVNTDDTVQKYEVTILDINRIVKNKTKSFSIKVTDEKLIEKTGGIVQGMSGSPILQNGKLVGAVTHVFVNDPTRGYGIFIENMLSEAVD